MKVTFIILYALLVSGCASSNQGPNFNKGPTIGAIAGIFTNDYNLEAELDETVWPALDYALARKLSDWNANRNRTKPQRVVEY